MSESDWVAKIDRGVLLAQRLQPFPELAGKALVVEREPAFVDDQAASAGRRAGVQCDERDRRAPRARRSCRSGPRSRRPGPEPLPAARPRHRATGHRDHRGNRAAARASASGIAAARTGRSACAPRTGAEASDDSADHRCSLASGVMAMVSRAENVDDPFRRPAALGAHRRSAPAAAARPGRRRRRTARRRDRANRRPWRAPLRGSSRRSRRQRPGSCG